MYPGVSEETYLLHLLGFLRRGLQELASERARAMASKQKGEAKNSQGPGPGLRSFYQLGSVWKVSL